MYIYIFAVNPKQNVGIDRYRNIPFQWPNRNGCRNGITNFDTFSFIPTQQDPLILP